MPRPLSRRRRIARGINLALISFLLTLAALEILLRIFAPQYQVYTQPDDLLGYSFIPNAHYDFVPPEQCPDWGSSGYINSQGLMDDEHALGAQAGVFRILALGDSQTEALQFDRSLRWTDVLEAQLNQAADGTTVEVINGARSGMGTTLQYLYYTERGRQYQPNLVILNMIYNDFVDNSAALLPDSRPYFVLRDGELVLDTSFRENPEYQALVQNEWARQHFFLVSFVRERLAYLRQAQAAQQAQSAAQPTVAEATPTPLDTQPYEDAIDVTLRVLLELNQEVQADGAKFAIVIGSAPWEEGFLQVLRERYPERPDMRMLDLIVEFAEANQIPVLPLETLLNDWVAQNQLGGAVGCTENNWSGHWHPASHAEVARLTLEFLQREGLLGE